MPLFKNQNIAKRKVIASTKTGVQRREEERKGYLVGEVEITDLSEAG